MKNFEELKKGDLIEVVDYNNVDYNNNVDNGEEFAYVFDDSVLDVDGTITFNVITESGRKFQIWKEKGMKTKEEPCGCQTIYREGETPELVMCEMHREKERELNEYHCECGEKVYFYGTKPYHIGCRLAK